MMPKDFYIICTPAESLLLQPILFEMGYTWSSGVTKVLEYDCEYLNVHESDGITWGSCIYDIDDADAIIYPAQKLLTPPELLFMEKLKDWK